ncbi:MAG: SGNH/GDSL hydrolase family protein [Clostridia bacterium]|nr:SGNH/GDSL hydrolase family protein [Clostridia bacterium]
MKLLFLGDSITEGVGAFAPEKNYVNLVARKLDCEVLNYGVSGTRIARRKKRSEPLSFDWDFVSRATVMEREADLIFVFGGTNDYGHGDAEIGEKGSFDPYTFCGSVNALISYLVSSYGKEKLCFILPLRRYDEVGIRRKSLEEFVDILRAAVKEKKSIGGKVKL